MTIPELAAHTELVHDKLSDRYDALGSTKILLDSAARKYIARTSGLAPLTSESVDPTPILTQFKLLLRTLTLHLLAI